MSIACGNRKFHPAGAQHDNVAAVRACYAALYAPVQPALAPQPVQAPVAVLERPQPQDIPVGAKGKGYFAVEIDDVLHFFQVDRPTEGKWAGFTFLKEQASDDLYPVRGARAKVILDLIARNPQGAGKAYADEIGNCWRCNRTLTDAASRAAGVGPVCAAL